MPIIVPPPRKLPDLGKSEKDPAKSCVDIKINGNTKADSDVYYIQPEKKTYENVV